MITVRWIGRALLLALLAWWTWRFPGHIVFAPFGEFMTVLGGSLLQVIISGPVSATPRPCRCR